MGSAFSENSNYFKLELICDNSQTINDVDDILNILKTKYREINEKISSLEKLTTAQSEIDAAILIRQSQYIDALLNKNKYELEKIFFPNGYGNCVIPDVFQWYQQPKE